MKKVIIILSVFVILMSGCSLMQNRALNVDQKQIDGCIRSIESLVEDNHVSKLVLYPFTNRKGRTDRYSVLAYEKVYQYFLAKSDATYEIIPQHEVEVVLNASDMKNSVSLTSFETTTLFDNIKGLDGICTGFVNKKSHYVVLFTPKEVYDDLPAQSKIKDTQWQVEISNLLKEMVDIVKKENDKVEPVCMTTFDNFTDRNNNALGKFLSYKIYTDLHRKYNMNVIQRADLPAILNEYKLNQTGFVNLEDGVEFGNLTGAKTILTGKTSGHIQDSWYINLSLVDLETGLTIWTGDYVKIGDDFLSSFELTGFENLDISNMNDFQRKVIYELINCNDEESSMKSMRKGILSLLLNQSLNERESFLFTKSVMDSLVSHQQYRMFEIDSLYIDKIKEIKEM